VGAVGSRLKLYVDGDPPIGMEPENDIWSLELDLTLEHFTLAKSFLEHILDGILEPCTALHMQLAYLAANEPINRTACSRYSLPVAEYRSR
jgi:hypothetical protein